MHLFFNTRFFTLCVCLLSLQLFGCARGGFLEEPAQTKPVTTGPADNPWEQERPTANEEKTQPTVGPLMLTVDSPPRGSVVNEMTVRVTGSVENLDGGRLLVNGTPVQTQANGAFSVDVPLGSGLNRLVTEVTRGNEYAEDRRGIMVGARVEASAKIEHAVTVHLGARGLSSFGRVVASAVDDIDIAEAIRGNGDDNGNFKVKDVEYRGLLVDIQPKSGFLKVRLVIQNLKIKFRGKFNVLFIPIVVHGDAEADAVTIEADVYVRQTTSGTIACELRDANVDMDGFDLDIENVANFITELFDDTARREGEKLLNKTLRDFVIPSLFSDDMLDQEIQLLGKTIELDLDVEQLDIDESGMTMILGSRVTVPQMVRQMGIVPMRTLPSERSADTGVQLATSVDFLNRILVSAWSAGVFDMEFSTEDEGFSTFGVPILRVALGDAANGLNNDDVLTFRIRPLLPPVASLDGDTYPLRLDMSDVLLDIVGPNSTLVTTSLDLQVGLGLSAEDGESIVIEPTLDIAVAADVAAMPSGQVNVSALEGQIEAVAKLIPSLVADQTMNLGNSATELPLRIFGIEFAASTNQQWLDLRALFDAL